MRISVDKSDPGYSPNFGNYPILILLDGKPLTGIAITADDVAGFVRFIPLNFMGTPVFDHRAGDWLKIDREGVVRIVFLSDLPERVQ